ncbi:MAG: hypothetical protein L6R41_007145 [Letrouitia leprolyta]|nr:MAG: hypothetical protein L6R41_007145 [Letrouitia leprolyta]
MLETTDQQIFFCATGPGGFDSRDIHMLETQSPFLYNDSHYNHGSLPPGYQQHYAIQPELRGPEQSQSVGVNQPRQKMDPWSRRRQPLQERNKVLSPSAGGPNQPSHASQSNPEFIWCPISPPSGPPGNQGNVAFAPVSARNPMLYRWISEGDQNLDECQVYPRGSMTGPRTAGYLLSSRRNYLRQEPYPYQGPEVTLTRPLAPSVYQNTPSTRSASQILPFKQQSKDLDIIIATNETKLTPTASSNHIFNMKMDPTPKKKRRTFSDAEKERIKHVRKHGACLECRSKKRKCLHVPVLPNDRPSPQSPDSEDNEPVTPDSLFVPSPINFSPEPDFLEEFIDWEPRSMM